MERAVSTAKVFPWVNALTAVLGLVLSFGFAYGATKLAEGQTRSDIENLKKQHEQSVTREELKIYIDSQNEKMKIYMDNTARELGEMNTTLREIRKEVRERK